MFIELEPGTDGEPLEEGDTIPVHEHRAGHRPRRVPVGARRRHAHYLKLLINGAGKGLEGHGNDLREVFRRLEPAPPRHRARSPARSPTGAPSMRAAGPQLRLAARRAGRQGQGARRAWSTSRTRCSSRSPSEEHEHLARRSRSCPATLGPDPRHARARCRRSRRCCSPTLESLRPGVPPARQGQPRGAAVRHARPSRSCATRSARSSARRAPVRARPAARPPSDLAEATPDLTASFHELNRFFNMAAYNPGGAEPVTGNEAARPQAATRATCSGSAGSRQNTDLALLDERRDRPVPPRARRLQLHRHPRDAVAQPAAGSIIGLTNVLNTPASAAATPRAPGGRSAPAERTPRRHAAPTAAETTAGEARWTSKARASAASPRWSVFALGCFGAAAVPVAGLRRHRSRSSRSSTRSRRRSRRPTTLAEEADVRIAGVNVGKVQKKELDKARRRDARRR